MADAKGHKFGQTLGEWCERAIGPLLREFADRHRLFLDQQGPRPARSGRKVTWLDAYGNAHDLDYVLERGGAPDRIGTPVALIESAWRRYTKHSRNKAQEIQGAVLPVRDRFQWAAPFVGCVLAGVYTRGALEQLRSRGFHLLCFQYDDIVAAFQTVGLDVRFDVDTTDVEFARKQRGWQRLTAAQQETAANRLIARSRDAVDEFMAALTLVVTREICSVQIIPLHGTAEVLASIPEAIRFVEACRTRGRGPLLRYEIQLRYSNGDRVDAQFAERGAAVGFLQQFEAGLWTPQT